MQEKKFFYDMFIENEVCYFSDYYTKQICFIDESKQLIAYNYCYDIDVVSNVRFFQGIYKLNNYILLCPWNTKNFFMLYDMKENKFIKKEIVSSFNIYLGFHNDDVFQYQDNVYIISNNMVIKSNCLFEEFECLLQINNIDENYEHGQIVCLDTKLYIPIQNIIYVFDMSLEKIYKKMTFNECEKIETLCYLKGNFWFITDKGKIVKYDEKYSISYDLPFETNYMMKGKNVFKFGRCYTYGKYIWFIPLYTDSIIRMDIEKNLIEKIEIEEEKEDILTIQEKKRKCIQKYLGINQNNNFVFFLSSKTENLYKLDLEKETIKILDLNWNKKIDNLVFINKDSSALFCEGYLGITIRDFIDNVCIN